MSGKLIVTCGDGRRVAWTGNGFVLHPFGTWACVSASGWAEVGIASSRPRTAATDCFMCLSQPSRISLTYLLMTATRGQLGCPVLIYWPYLNVAGSAGILCSHLQGDWPCCVAEMWYFLSSVSGTNKALVLFVALLPLFMSCFLCSVAKTLLHTLQPCGSALLWNNLHAHLSALHPRENILIVAPWAGLVGWHKAVGSGYSSGTNTASVPLREADYRQLSKQEASARDKII